MLPKVPAPGVTGLPEEMSFLPGRRWSHVGRVVAGNGAPRGCKDVGDALSLGHGMPCQGTRVGHAPSQRQGSCPVAVTSPCPSLQTQTAGLRAGGQRPGPAPRGGGSGVTPCPHHSPSRCTNPNRGRAQPAGARLPPLLPAPGASPLTARWGRGPRRGGFAGPELELPGRTMAHPCPGPSPRDNNGRSRSRSRLSSSPP